MVIVVAGFSGCGITVRPATDAPSEAGVRNVLEKTSASVPYNPRLHKQLDKQEAYSRKLEQGTRRGDPNAPAVVVPRVLYRREMDGAPLVAGMVFEHHTDCITFMARAPISEVKQFSSALVNLIDLHVELSEVVDVPSAVFTDKLADIKRVVGGNPALSECVADVTAMLDGLTAVMGATPSHSMPLGCCHGDLTLSNVLIQRAGAGSFRIVLIDFLDSFVESPLADMAKLCQDLVYGWTLRMAKDTAVDRTRIYIVYRHIYELLLDRFGAQPWFARYFRFFFVMNQLRVLQYATAPEDRDYLVGSCKEQYAAWRDAQAAL